MTKQTRLNGQIVSEKELKESINKLKQKELKQWVYLLMQNQQTFYQL